MTTTEKAQSRYPYPIPTYAYPQGDKPTLDEAMLALDELKETLDYELDNGVPKFDDMEDTFDIEEGSEEYEINSKSARLLRTIGNKVLSTADRKENKLATRLEKYGDHRNVVRRAGSSTVSYAREKGSFSNIKSLLALPFRGLNKGADIIKSGIDKMDDHAQSRRGDAWLLRKLKSYGSEAKENRTNRGNHRADKATLRERKIEEKKLKNDQKLVDRMDNADNYMVKGYDKSVKVKEKAVRKHTKRNEKLNATHGQRLKSKLSFAGLFLNSLPSNNIR
jgi:hypothetical protein